MAGSDVAAFLVALDGAIVGWGPGATNLFGYGADELIGRPVSDLVPPEGASDFPRILAAIARGEVIDATETMIRKDGNRLVVSLAVVPSRDGGGRVTGARAVARDVSDEQAEEARARLAAILSSTADAMCALDADAVIRTWNPGAERLYGYAAHQAVGLPGVSLVPAHHHDEARMAFECVLAGEPVQLFESEARRNDGVLVPVSLNLWPVHDRSGSVVGISVIARDLTNERMVLAALAESEVRLRESESLVHAGGWAWDVATGAVQWSEETHRIHGIDPAGFAGTLDAHLDPVHPDDRQRVRAAMTAAVSLAEPLEIEYRIVRPKGPVRYVHVRGEVALAPSDAVIVAGLRGICQDITDRATAAQRHDLDAPVALLVDRIRQFPETDLPAEQRIAVSELRELAENLQRAITMEGRPLGRKEQRG